MGKSKNLTTPPWWSQLLVQRHSFYALSHPIPEKLCGRGWPRADLKGFIYVGHPRHKNVLSGSIQCQRGRAVPAKSADIWLSGRHVADMSAILPAKLVIQFHAIVTLLVPVVLMDKFCRRNSKSRSSKKLIFTIRVTLFYFLFCRSLCRRGWQRVVFKGFILFGILAKKKTITQLYKTFYLLPLPAILMMGTRSTANEPGRLGDQSRWMGCIRSRITINVIERLWSN